MKVNWKAIAKFLWSPIVFVLSWYGLTFLNSYNEAHPVAANPDDQIAAVLGFFSFLTNGSFLIFTALLIGIGIGMLIQKLLMERRRYNTFILELRELRYNVQKALEFSDDKRESETDIFHRLVDVHSELIGFQHTARKAGFRLPKVDVLDKFQLACLKYFLDTISPTLEKGHHNEAKKLAIAEAEKIERVIEDHLKNEKQ